MLHDSTLDAIESFCLATGLDNLDARRLTRRINQGEASAEDLPTATDVAAQTDRSALVSSIEAALPAQNAEPATVEPAVNTVIPEVVRAGLIRQMAGERFAASAEVLIDAGTPLAEAGRILAMIGEAAPAIVSRPRIPTIAERAAGVEEMGPNHFQMPMSKSEQVSRSWRKAIANL